MVYPIRLLYAEDNPQDVDLTCMHFAQEAPEFIIHVVDSAASCLDQLGQHAFDVLLLDNHLPDADGIDLLARLRAAGQRLPVVMVTGVGDDETVARALRAGASDYVSKSGDYLDGLPVLLRALVSRHQEKSLLDTSDSLRDQRILYIEPNEMDVELTLAHFASHAPRLNLHVTSSCVDALNLLTQANGFDLVLTDLRVPGMDALEFIHRAKSNQINLPFVVITGKGDEATAVALLRLGASDYLVKRENYLVQLPHAIEHALHRFRLDQSTRRLQRELMALNSALEAKVTQRTGELHDMQARLRATFDAIPDLIWQKDCSGRYQACNSAMERLLGRTQANVLGQTDVDLFDADQALTIQAQDQQAIDAGQAVIQTLQLSIAGTDRQVWYEVLNTPMRNDQGELVGLLGVARDMTERKASEARISQLAYFDVLTGLPNRLLLEDRSAYALSAATRNQTPLAVLMLDLDNFKNVNESLGHSVGDVMLVEVAKRLRQATREEDTVARLGGDEFLLILPGSDPVAAAQVAGKLLEVLSAACSASGHELVITPSIGIAMFPQDGAEFGTLFKRADIAMYRAKHAGRNQFCFFASDMQVQSGRMLRLQTDLRQAIKRNELVLHFQPQWSFSSRRIMGVEALVRWQHPALGLVSPGDFIPVAEKTGQIIAIGEWVMRQALSELKIWMAHDLAPVIMSVNLSALQFRHSHLPDMVQELLEELQVSPQWLELELTESAMMDEPLTAIAVMNELRARGVAMSIDDFGTGYSSLAYLKRFKVSQLKIDRSFVSDIVSSPDDRTIVKTILGLAQSMGIQTIAEGVETAEQLRVLRGLGCECVQGYYLGRPMPADSLLLLLQGQPELPPD